MLLSHTKSEKIQIILLVFFGLLFFSTLYNRYIQIDENFFTEQAYWLVEEGVVKIKSIPEIFNWDSYFLVYHKFFVWIVAALYSVFGLSVYAFKSYTLIVFLSCIFIASKYFLNNGGYQYNKFLPAILFLSTPLMIVKGFELRPEPTIMLIGFSSFLFLERSRKLKYPTVNVAIAGLLAGLAFLTHLNGAIFCIAGFFYLVYFKKFKHLLIFTLCGSLTGGIYFSHLLGGDLFQEWLYNLKNWPSHNYKENLEGSGFLGLLGNYISKLASEHKRYFWDLSIISLSVFFIGVLVVMFKTLWNKHKGLILYSFLALFFLALLGSSKSPRYLIFFLPFIVLIISFGLNYIHHLKPKVCKAFSYFIVVAIVFQLGSSVAISKTIWDLSYDQEKRIKNMLYSIPKGSKVLGPWELIFTGIKDYQLYNYKTYEYLQEKRDSMFNQLEILAKANELGIEYFIVSIDIAGNNEFGWFPDFHFEENNPWFSLMEANDRYLILKRK